MKAKRAADFRIQRKNVGLTWSCPVDQTQPIPSKEVILADVTALYGHSQYVVAHELHESGQSHYHAYFKFDGKLELTDPRCFDLYGVHPNIVGSAGPAWANYCRKKGDYISNMDKRNCHAEALAASTVKEAVDIIKRHDPAAYNRFGEALERNLRRHIAPTSTLPSARFQGPHPTCRFPTDWDPHSHSLLIWGPPGSGKYSFAMYYAGCLCGQFAYCRAHVEDLRSLNENFPFVFDEVT